MICDLLTCKKKNYYFSVSPYLLNQIQLIFEHFYFNAIFFSIRSQKEQYEGLGLFACQDIPKGAVWWYYDEKIKGIPCLNAKNLDTLILTQENLDQFVKSKIDEELYDVFQHTLYYKDGDVLIYLRDGSESFKHSFLPNSRTVFDKQKKVEKMYSVALRDIKAGEQITEDYSNYASFSGNWAEKVFRKYDLSRLQFEEKINIKQIQL